MNMLKPWCIFNIYYLSAVQNIFKTVLIKFSPEDGGFSFNRLHCSERSPFSVLISLWLTEQTLKSTKNKLSKELNKLLLWRHVWGFGAVEFFRAINSGEPFSISLTVDLH